MAGLTVRRAPYKDFLQPALQRRFASTAIILLTVSYAEALALAQWNSFIWPWFPLGGAGVRTAFIFTCGLAILVLRIANYHVGLRTIGTGSQTLRASLTKLSTYETAFWYFFSSTLFSPVFLWSMPESANLSWVTYFSGDRARVNERTLFLASYLGFCALRQSIVHFTNDIDRLDLGISRQNGTKDQSASLKRVILQFPRLLAHSVQMAFVSYIVSSVVYFTVVRSIAWGWALMFLRPFYNLPKANLLPLSWPVDVFLVIRCVFAGTLLFFMWSAANIAFSIFMVQEPLKNDQPLTSESKDPNGSLLNGLKSKKPSIQFFAMWELSRIAERFEPRRKAIYVDIDRKEGPMWSQVYAVCMDVVKSIDTRAKDYGKPPAPAQPAQAAVNPRSQITNSSLRNDPIFNTSAPNSRAGKFATLIDQGAHALGSGASHDSGNSPLSKLSPIAKKTWAQTKDSVLTKEQQDAVSSEGIKNNFQSTTLQLIKSLHWVDLLFRQDFRTAFTAAVLGGPYAEPAFYCHAVNALCQLAVHSLGEDQFGNVHRDVPNIIRTLTSVIQSVEALKQRFPVHWTDAGSDKDTPEVDQVLEALRTGLGQIVASFEPFSHDLRLTQGDLRQAKEAAEKPKLAAPQPVAEKEKVPEKTSRQIITEKVAQDSEARQPSRRRHSRPEMEQVRHR
ncbi:unnamed protein product [Clonostachys rosea f. rosea IK726]|uniref:Uncharacterized protein n=1 Tax=Clonostachys rosea f. rosea IK726 TaxID=1349383 RepID=A0ACA9TTC6_BIOOC|nr:unnamed protein product [Clonostachys rosea f. rosea IK726]